MRRRDFIVLFGGAATCWPLTVRGQQAGKIPVVGFLGTTTPSAQSTWTAAFVQRMSELGWFQGRTISIEYRRAEGHFERYAAIAAEFVRLKVDVILTAGTAVPALKRATTDIPIVFGLDADPVGRGLVASLARPGGNVTGLSTQGTDAVGKRLALLREAVPTFHRLAILTNAGFAGAVEEKSEVETIARAAGLDVAALEIRRAEDIAPPLPRLRALASV
jgi:putative ABC transport system substrate-binding protein